VLLRNNFFKIYFSRRFNSDANIWTVISGCLLPRMVSPQVAGGGTASSMKGSCKYIEKSSRGQPTRVVLELGGWARC